jgi:hypothetical protein
MQARNSNSISHCVNETTRAHDRDARLRRVHCRLIEIRRLRHRIFSAWCIDATRRPFGPYMSERGLCALHAASIHQASSLFVRVWSMEQR